MVQLVLGWCLKFIEALSGFEEGVIECRPLLSHFHVGGVITVVVIGDLVGIIVWVLSFGNTFGKSFNAFGNTFGNTFGKSFKRIAAKFFFSPWGLTSIDLLDLG